MKRQYAHAVAIAESRVRTPPQKSEIRITDLSFPRGLYVWFFSFRRNFNLKTKCGIPRPIYRSMTLPKQEMFSMRFSKPT